MREAAEPAFAVRPIAPMVLRADMALFYDPFGPDGGRFVPKGGGTCLIRRKPQAGDGGVVAAGRR